MAPNKITLEQLKQFVATATADQIQYELNYYCGRGRDILREKKYELEAAKQLQKILTRALDYKITDEWLLDDSE